MKRFINWHKEMCELFMEWSGTDWYTTAWISWVKGIIMGIIIMSLLTSCYVTSYIPDPIYEDRPHTTEVYYNGIDIYWGYHTGFYYYYGTPHYYPWWYYYQAIPPHHHHTHTHVYVNCDNGYYVYGHRGSKFNNSNGGNYVATIKPRTNRSKTNVFPHNWKSSNSTRTTKNNDNRIYVKPNTQHNTSPVIIKNNNTNTNRSNNTKVNTNKNNNKTRINNKVKTNRKPR